MVRLDKAIKTDNRYYLMLEYCNGGDIEELMKVKKWQISLNSIQKIMKQLVTGMNDMMKVNVIHRDLKLENIMMHFPKRT